MSEVDLEVPGLDQEAHAQQIPKALLQCASLPVKLAYLVTHPIQYQAPLLRRLASCPGIDLTVLFQSDLSLRGYKDRGFGRSIKWDVPLLGGYEHKFHPAIGSTARISAWRPLSYGIPRHLRRGGYHALWIHGYARPYNIAAILAAHRLGIRVLVRDEATQISRERNPRRERLKQYIFRAVVSHGGGFLPIGTLNHRYYRELGVPEQRLFMMPYCVDNEMFRARAAEASASRTALKQSLGIGENAAIFLYASKFETRKRAEDLVEAYAILASRLPESERPYLLMVGDGKTRAQLQDLCQERGLDRVQYLGFRNQTELPGLFDLADVFVLPSVHEPWGLVVNEAMNGSCAIVVSDQVGCAPDLVKDGVNGFVVPAQSPHALADALMTLATNRARTREMGEESLRIIATWNFDRDLEGLTQALGAILGNTSDRRR